MALGAPREGVRWLVIRQALLLGTAGAAGGVLAAALGTRALAGLLHGVTPLDGPTFAAAGVVLVMLAAVSAWIPARAAARVDPSEALRDS
jgi:ABC-type antimicrobial peptide transport system permease subunit